MASPKPYASVSEECSEVQVLDSNEPLVTPSSSGSSSSARVLDSREPLVPTTPVQVMDSMEPIVLSGSFDEEPVAGPSGLAVPRGIAGPSGVAAGSGGDTSFSEDDEEESVPAVMLRRSGLFGRRVHPYSEELRSMWNWRKIFERLGTTAQCIQFAEDRGLILREKMCPTHKKPMSLSEDAGQLGRFRCRKSNCRTKPVSRSSGSWFERVRFPITMVFQIMYAFCEGLKYHQVQKELADENNPVVSSATIADWYSYCRETVELYELQNNEAEGKIGGPNKVVQIDESKFGRRKYNRGRQIEGHWVIGMIEDGKDDLRLEVCPDNERSAEILVPLIKKHVQEGSIIHTDCWRAYNCLPEHGYIHKKVNHSDPINKFVAPDGTHTQRIESQWRGLKKQFRVSQNNRNFTQWLVEYSWRRRILYKHLDPFEELIKAINYVYKVE